MNDKAMAELLLKNGANIEAEGKMEETPLMKAVDKRNAEMVQLLISKGANLQTRNYYSQTPFDVAVEERFMTFESLVLLSLK